VPAAATTRTRTTDEALAARARAFEAERYERAAERVVAVDGARVLSHSGVPHWPDLNAVHLVDPSLDADAVAALAGGLPVVAADEASGEALAASLGERGWEVQRLLWMVRDGTLAPPEAVVLAEEVPYGQVRPLRDEWTSVEPWTSDQGVIEEMREADRLIFAATPPRAFCVFERGLAVAYSLLLDAGRDGVLEDVYTSPAARGRGLGTATIAAVLWAARGAGHEAVFVLCDPEGRARALYERCGFRPLTTMHRLRRA
jgi:GNAT superfamily N-acetyltransferase